MPGPEPEPKRVPEPAPPPAPHKLTPSPFDPFLDLSDFEDENTPAATAPPLEDNAPTVVPSASPQTVPVHAQSRRPEDDPAQSQPPVDDATPQTAPAQSQPSPQSLPPEGDPAAIHWRRPPQPSTLASSASPCAQREPPAGSESKLCAPGHVRAESPSSMAMSGRSSPAPGEVELDVDLPAVESAAHSCEPMHVDLKQTPGFCAQSGPTAGPRTWSSASGQSLQPGVSRSRLVAHPQSLPWIQPESKSHCVGLIVRMSAFTRSLDGYQLKPFDDPTWLTDGLRAYMVWEMTEIEFRNGLYAVNYVLRRTYPESTLAQIDPAPPSHMWARQTIGTRAEVNLSSFTPALRRQFRRRCDSPLLAMTDRPLAVEISFFDVLEVFHTCT
ncbi:hypothetical protein AURDEDRAFT_167850 [Auricularia subglabra TFB-10046 SS5]|nr:hypothetical protein AURDEDRAFT_167850 [Auricularia subglabra TFB-10046 SS5]